MPVYEYKALDKKGKHVKGIIDADSAVTARNKLRSTDMYPVDLKETSAKPRVHTPGHISLAFLFRSVKQRELSTMTRQLATLMGAGISLVASFDLLITQESNPVLKKILAQIKESVNEGNSLAFSLSEHSRYFSPIYINMVKAGEASGSLDVVLERLAEFGENQDALKGRFKAAMVYPVIMLIIGVLALLLLVTFVVPNFVEVFRDMEKALPLPTIMVIGASNILKSYWWLIIIFILGLVFAFRQFKKSTKGQHIWDGIKLSAPVLGPVNMRIIMARFGRTLGSLIQSGVPLVSALEIVRNIVSNAHIAEVIDKTLEEINEGKSLAYPLSKSRLIPPVVTQMIAVGEQSGELEKMLNKVADIYEQEAESRLTAMTSMLEPVMLLFMAVMVGFIAFAILLPILEMSQIVH